MARPRWSSPFGSALVLCSCLTAACKNQAPPAAEAPEPPAPSAPLSPAAAAPADPRPGDTAEPGKAASTYNEAGFDLSLSPKDNYAVGQSGEADIVLVAKAPFHVNQSYPYKFKLKESPGLKFANLVVGKDAVKLEAARAEVPVLFTPDSSGKHVLAGVLSFSVCTEDKCMIEKRELALEIDAK